METPEDSQVHAETSPTAGVIRTDTLTLTSSSCLASDSTHVWRGGQFEESKASMNPGQDSTPNPVSPHKLLMAKNSKGCAVVYCSNTYYNVARSEKKISFFRLPRDSQRYTKFHIAYYETLAMCFSCRLRSYTFQYHYCHGDPFKII